LGWDLRKRLDAVFIILIFLAHIIILIPHVEASYSANLTYYIEVKENANATIKMIFKADGSGIGFVSLPLFEKYTVNVTTGSVEWVKYEDISVFYTNATFKFSGKPVEMIISYEFPYASLVSGDTAWFMSNYILASPNFNVFVEVKLYGLNSEKEIRFWPYHPVERKGNIFVFHIKNPLLDNRVIIEYKLANEVPTISYEKTIGETKVAVHVAEYYRDIADKVFYAFEKTYDDLKYVFRDLPSKLDFECYLPELNDLTALGYVKERTIDVGAEGPIYLNLALIRFKEGFLEETTIHEFVHLALGRLGVSSKREIRWFHEGMAEYLAIKLCNRSGIDVSDYVETHREAVKVLLKEYDGDLSFIIDWEYNTPLIRLYYSASYYIINKTAEKYGGLAYIRKLVSEIDRMGGLESNEDIVKAMSNAANEDLSQQFREWGFPIKEKENGVVSNGENDKILRVLHEILETLVVVAAIIVIILIAIVILLIRWFTKRLKRPPLEYASDIYQF